MNKNTKKMLRHHSEMNYKTGNQFKPYGTLH